MSAALVPNRLMFRFEVPVRRAPDGLGIDGHVAKWTDELLFPPLCRLDGRQPFGRVWIAWSEAGLFVACAVAGKRLPLRCSPQAYWKGDNLRLCTDMRGARDIRRASRFCQQFYFLPTGGPAGGPVGGSARILRAREDAPIVPPGRIRVAARVADDGYFLEAHVPADALAGFDPEEHRRIGIYYMLEDGDFGQQYLTVGDDLGWYIDPSTWATGVLVD